jgi:hypothetical protein
MVDFCRGTTVHPKGKSMSQAMIDRRSRGQCRSSPGRPSIRVEIAAAIAEVP